MVNFSLLICYQVTSTRKERSDLYGFWVKLPAIIWSRSSHASSMDTLFFLTGHLGWVQKLLGTETKWPPGHLYAWI